MPLPKISPYLNVDNAREALAFYKACFGGEVFIMKVSETPMAKQMPADSQDKVMHSSLTADQVNICISEMQGPEGFIRGNTVSLMINCDSDAELQGYFDKLSPGGKVMMPPGETFWGAKFASFRDKYDVQWLLNYTLPPEN